MVDAVECRRYVEYDHRSSDDFLDVGGHVHRVHYVQQGRTSPWSVQVNTPTAAV